MTSIDSQKVFKYWLEEAERSKIIMNILLKKKECAEALFFGHLILEKLFKAYFVKKNKKPAPPIHNLLSLAKECGFVLEIKDKENLDEISRFNLAARYDEIKQSFRKECTLAFMNKYAVEINKYYIWLKKELSLFK